jgi:hypothetical protein
MKSVSAFTSAINETLVLSICRRGKCSSRSLKVKISSSFFNKSARAGPTPFKYSIGVSNILFAA